MSLKAYNIDVPITPGVMPPVIHIGQYDSGRDYICHLKNDDGTDYTIPAGTTATFTGCNPRKEVFELEATVDTSANTVTITPQDEATSMFGKYGATINLELNGEKMSPIVILMDVQKAGATDEEIAGAANFPDAVTEAVENYVDELREQGEAWPAKFICTFTTTAGVTTCDKTYAEVVEADASQNIISCDSSEGAGWYAGIVDDSAVFYVVETGGGAPVLTRYELSANGVSVNYYSMSGGGGLSGGAEIYYVNITASGSGYVSDKTFAEISAADAAGNIIVPRYNYFEGRMVKLTDEYAALSIIDLAIPEIPILRTFTVNASGTTGTGIDIGGAAYIYLVKNGDDYDIDTTYTPAILQTRGNVLNYFYDGIAVKLMYNGYAHPLVYHYGDGILKFGGPEYTTVNGHHVQQDVVYTWSASSHVAREVVTPLNADLLTEKTAAMTQAVGYRASDGTLWTVPGSGGGSGAELFEVTITVSGSVYSASETVADIMTAYQSGKLVKYYNEVGAEGLLFAAPTASGITFVCFDDADGGHPTTMTIYSIAADGTVTPSSEDILNGLLMPSTQTRTAAQMASGLLAMSNVVYTITGDATGFVLTNSTNPITTPGECVEIRLTVGSTAITTPTWPSWCKLMNGWDGTFAASTYYDIIIDDAGNVYSGTREVSA